MSKANGTTRDNRQADWHSELASTSNYWGQVGYSLNIAEFTSLTCGPFFFRRPPLLASDQGLRGENPKTVVWWYDSGTSLARLCTSYASQWGGRKRVTIY